MYAYISIYIYVYTHIHMCTFLFFNPKCFSQRKKQPLGSLIKWWLFSHLQSKSERTDVGLPLQTWGWASLAFHSLLPPVGRGLSLQPVLSLVLRCTIRHVTATPALDTEEIRLCFAVACKPGHAACRTHVFITGCAALSASLTRRFYSSDVPVNSFQVPVVTHFHEDKMLTCCFTVSVRLSLFNREPDVNKM